MEDDTIQGKMKWGMINLKFSVMIVTNMVIILMIVKVPLAIWKNKPTMLRRNMKKNLPYCWYIKEKVKKKTHNILALEQTITCVVSKTCL